MLVLTRKIGESIIINDDIEVKILEVDGSSVRLGIEAPQKVRVLRREIQEAVREENIRAARDTGRLMAKIKQLGKEKKGK